LDATNKGAEIEFIREIDFRKYERNLPRATTVQESCLLLLTYTPNLQKSTEIKSSRIYEMFGFLVSIL